METIAFYRLNDKEIIYSSIYQAHIYLQTLCKLPKFKFPFSFNLILVIVIIIIFYGLLTLTHVQTRLLSQLILFSFCTFFTIYLYIFFLPWHTQQAFAFHYVGNYNFTGDVPSFILPYVST